MANFAQVKITFTESQTLRLAEWRKKRLIPPDTSDDSFVRAIVIERMNEEVPKVEKEEKKTEHTFE